MPVRRPPQCNTANQRARQERLQCLGFSSMASGYRAEIEKMQREVLEYLTRHVSQPTPAEIALIPVTRAEGI
jgi:hypothetical protein